MLKAVLAGTAALAIAGSTLVLAQQGPAPVAGPHEVHRHWQPSADDLAALTDARIAALKAGLKLTPDQEKNWPALDQAIRDFAKDRQERRAAHEAQVQQGQRPDAIARLRSRADAMTATATDLKKIADAAQPLYQTLDDGQKHRLVLLSHIIGGGHRHFAAMGHEHRGHDGERFQ